MSGLLLLIGFPTGLVGTILCLNILWTGEGNPITALAVLAAGVLLSAPGWRKAQTEDWPRR